MSFLFPISFFSQWASVRRKQEPLELKLLSGFLSMSQPEATLWPLLREACWTCGHDSSSPLVLWVAFLPTWTVTSPLLGRGNLIWRTQRQKPWKLPANEDSSRQGCRAHAPPLRQRKCMSERRAQQSWSQQGVLGRWAVEVPVPAREGRPRSH